MTVSRYDILLGNKKLSFETGKIARQANGAVWLSQGDSVVLATACASPEPLPDVDFLPLKVDYQEKFSSVGKTLGGFIKREGRPTQREILTSRLIDRPLRPLFVDGYHHDVQVLAYVLSYDTIHQPDTMAINAASAALVLSDIPLIKPIAGVRVGMIKGEFVIEPTVEELSASSLDLVLAGTEDAILMIEGACSFLTEEELLNAIEFGHSAIKTICHGLIEWQKQVGKPKNQSTLRLINEKTQKAVHAFATKDLNATFSIKEKQARDNRVLEIKAATLEALAPEGKESEHTEHDVLFAFKDLHSHLMRKMIMEQKVRLDGRGLEDIRPISIEMGLLPRTHGSALFTRGETQSLAVCTLGGETMAQRFEDLHGEDTQRFYLQYFFPPFSVGEVGRIGSPGRREVGHGKLAEKALEMALPPAEAFPYVIRLESNITESNGSSSMASVCGGCLALMEAGVPLQRPVAGIAMGLILFGNQFTILSDILGAEDALGDMDFKVTGDAQGITAFQMDIKVEGITSEILRAALMQAKRGRVHILQKMLDVCPKPKSVSIYAPRIEKLQIKPSKIGAVIGPGGKQIRSIIEESGAQVDIDDSGVISLSAPSFDSIEKAKAMIQAIVAEIEVGKIYQGRVAGVAAFGLFVEVLPGKQGLCHISELDTEPVKNTADFFLQEGDPITIMVDKINERGQIQLSRRRVLLEQAGKDASKK